MVLIPLSIAKTSRENMAVATMTTTVLRCKDANVGQAAFRANSRYESCK